MQKQDDLKTSIQIWDGKTVAVMNRVYEAHHQEDGFIAALLEMMMHPKQQKGATWLLKKHLESGRHLDVEQIAQVYDLLAKQTDDEAKLHLLQAMPFMPIGKTHVAATEVFLRTCLGSKHKFVRAWAYNGFYELARQHKGYQKEAQRLLEQALQDEAASVKARVRNILKNAHLLES